MLTNHTHTQLGVRPRECFDLQMQTTEELSGLFQPDLCGLESKPSIGVILHCFSAVSLQMTVRAVNKQ